MPNIDDLVNRIADIIASKRSGTAWFTCLDLRYAYGLLLLSSSTANQCNFSVLGGLATGTYQFATGFYGLTDMPADFQQAIDRTIAGLPFAHAFIDEILICTMGTAANHIREIDIVLSLPFRALLSALKSNRGNKTTFSRLAYWVDRLLPFDFNLLHIPGKNGWG